MEDKNPPEGNQQLRLEFIDPKTLSPNPRNWRQHPKAQRKSLEALISRVGWAGVALYNERTGHLIDGHLRKEIAEQRGEKIPVLIGSWSEKDEKTILLSLDPVGDLATRNYKELEQLYDLIRNDEILAKLFRFEKETPYSPKIDRPHYKPSEIKPEITDLFDDKKMRELIAEIDSTDGLSEEEKYFLRLASARHVVFRFDKIADYYAHSPAHIKRLFERNGLVIVDLNQAIENAWIKLTKRMLEHLKEETEGVE